MSTKVLVFAGFAGLVAGTLAAAAVEYSKTGAERDQQVAQLTSEQIRLAAAPDAELVELIQQYVACGLSRRLAREVAIELTAHDALAAHAEVEHGITPTSMASPFRDALAPPGASDRTRGLHRHCVHDDYLCRRVPDPSVIVVQGITPVMRPTEATRR